MSDKVTTPIFRGSFVNAFQGVSYKSGKPKFGVTAVWLPKLFSDDDKKRWKAMMALLNDRAVAAFQMKWKNLPANYRKGVRNGNEKTNRESFPEGCYFASLTCQQPPGVVGTKRGENGKLVTFSELNGNTNEIYSGAYYRATVNAYDFTEGSPGVALGLNNLQKIKDGDRLDGRTNAHDDFADEETDEAWMDEEESAVDDDEIDF